MKLYICRHGETEDNLKGISQGHLPGKLTEKGKQEARSLAMKLKSVKLDAIFSSPLKRAADTAKIIADFHKEINIEYKDELKECDLGPWTGLHYSKCNYNGELPQGMETRKSMLERAKKVIDETYKKYPNKTVLFVCHNGIARALITVIFNKGEGFFQKMSNQKSTALNLFEIFENKNHIVHLLNDDSHLD